MPKMSDKKFAFAVCATGERCCAYKNNAVRALARYVPEAEIIDIDITKTGDLLSDVPDADKAQLARLAIPLMEEFHEYDIVVWVDVDTEVVSRRFVEIFDVETGRDGLAAVPDVEQGKRICKIKEYFPDWRKDKYFNSGVLVMDLRKIKPEIWKSRALRGIKEYARKKFWSKDQEIFNGLFDISEIDSRFNCLPGGEVCSDDAWLVHYAGRDAKRKLDHIVEARSRMDNIPACGWRERCVVVSPRHDFIKPWIRAYFAAGNTTPLVIVPGPPGDWRDGDMEYCREAARFSNGIVFDCSEEWHNSARLSERAVRNNVGWYTKKSILHAVAAKLNPVSWAWVDDDAEVTGDLGECFDYAERAPGFICAQFYYPDQVDTQHPSRLYRSNIDPDDKICWNSLVFFHGDANSNIAKELGRDFPIEDDEIIFCELYKTDGAWHDGFCDFSIRAWQKNCKRIADIPADWRGKLLHYTSTRDGRAVKKMWAAKADTLPDAPFESGSRDRAASDTVDPVDAVFVIGTGSLNNNEELRYALRNIEAHCRFVRDVYICGHCPSWVDKCKVRYLQWPDRFTHAKDANIIDKLRHACEHPGIAKRILFCSDDQFQTRACTWDDFAPRYLRRYSSNDTWYEDRNRVWHSRLRNTLERDVQRRIANGLDPQNVFYYQPHIWMPIDRDKFISYAKWCNYEKREDTIIASGYFNFIDAKGRPDFDHIFIASGAKGVPDATHVAYHDGSYDAAMGMLRKLFPNKSRFELDTAPKGVLSRNYTRTNSVYCDNDPGLASPEETSRILSVMEAIRKNPVWHNLLGEVSRAEEMRLFCARGWRIVWSDIIRRWSDATKDGLYLVPVCEHRSHTAKGIIGMYLSTHNAAHGATAGLQSPSAVRQLPRPPSSDIRSGAEIRNSLRGKLGESLRLRGK